MVRRQGKMPENILKVKDLNKEFKIKTTQLFSRSKSLKVLKDISFELLEGESLSIVGESGSGKTTLGRCVLNGMDVTSGEVIYQTEDNKEVDYLNLTKKEFQKYRKDIQMIFQDPYSSLNPRMTVYDIIAEPLITNFDVTKK